MNKFTIIFILTLFLHINAFAESQFSTPQLKQPLTEIINEVIPAREPQATQMTRALPTIQNEITPDSNWKYQILFSFSNNQLNNEAMNFYAKIDPKTGILDKISPVIWRREGRNGTILIPKKLQLKKVGLLFTPTFYSDPESAKFKLNFQLYKPGTSDTDKGINVSREFVVKKDKGTYEAFFMREGLEPITLKQIHSSIHLRNFGKALMGDPEGTNAYWARVTSEDGSNEYIVPDEYYLYSKSMPQGTDPTFKPTGARFVDQDGAEVSIHPVKNR